MSLPVPKDDALDAIRALVEPVLADVSAELVESTLHRQGRQLIIRLLVDKVGGVTIQDCTRLNRSIGQALDEADLVDEPYTLEVSSPGLDRPLVSRRDFERALGEELNVELVEAMHGRRQLTGQLLAVQLEAIVMITRAGNVTIPLMQIQRAVKALRW